MNMAREQEKEKKRIQLLEKLEVAIKKDPLDEFENLLSKYYMEIKDSIEELKELREKYPQFPETTEYFYESAVNDEKAFEEYIADEEEELEQFPEEKEYSKEIPIKEAELLKLAESGNKDFVSKYLNFMEISGLSDEAFEVLNQNKDKIIPQFIDQINKMKTVHQQERDIEYAIRDCLTAIGKIRCDESVNFLNNLLDNYMEELGKYNHDDESNKYINFDFFHILDCMVKQQDKRSIAHIIKARDFFPKEYTDFIVCQIAAGRIKKGRNEGYLPMEALEIAFPTGSIFNMLSDGETKYEDKFEESYGEYFDNN
jgi:hypothetical protein